MSGYGALIAYSLGRKRGSVTAAGTHPNFCQQAEDLAELPNAPGKDVTVRVCAACHGVALVPFAPSQTAWETRSSG